MIEEGSDHVALPPISEIRAFTPVEIETWLALLFNALAKNQLSLMRLRSAEMDAKLAYERAHIVITTDPDCPKVERGGWTVAEREDYIRGLEFTEYEAYEHAKKRVRNCRDYLDTLREQTSILQSLNRSVTTAYLGTPR